MVQEWCSVNRLSLNVKKTKFLTFVSDHKRKHTSKFRFLMNGNTLEEVSSYRYLGTEIDNRLNGEMQYNKLMQTLGFKLATFSKIRRFLNTRAALTVYRSTVLPLIDYNVVES